MNHKYKMLTNLSGIYMCIISLIIMNIMLEINNSKLKCYIQKEYLFIFYLIWMMIIILGIKIIKYTYIKFLNKIK